MDKRPTLPYYDEPPTKLEHLVNMVGKTATSETVGSVHPISVRIPTIEYTTIQAISHHSGMSMNKTICQLLDVALDELWQQLGEEDRDRIAELRSGYINNIMANLDKVAQADKGEV